jgi:hypothetical protein
MASVHDHEHGDWVPSVEARHLFRTLSRFTQNQEELLYIADYIVEKKSDMDDQKEQSRIYSQRMFPDVPLVLFDEAWEVLERMRERSKAEFWPNEGSQDSDVPVSAGLTDTSDAVTTSGSVADDESPDVGERQQASHHTDTGSEGEQQVPKDESQEAAASGDDEIDLAFDSVMSRLPESCRYEFMTSISSRISRERRHSPRVLSSLLTSVIADFEVMVGGLLRYSISRAPKLIESSERTYTWADIATYSDLEEFKAAQIDKMVDSILYGSFQSWLEFLAKRFGISAASLATADGTVEIFQRRNLVVHTGGQVSQQYLDNVSKAHQAKLGTNLSVDVDYLQRASDTMLVMGVTLIYSAASKMVKDAQSMRWLEDYLAGGLIYNLLHAQRFWAVSEIIENLNLDSFKSKGGALRGQVNAWLALKRQGRRDECLGDIENWDTSVLEPIFKLARAALLDDFEYADVLAQELRGTPVLPTIEYLTWPLLEELREYEREQAKRTPEY